MSQIRAIIIEDEPRSAELLEKLLEKHCADVDVVASTGSLETALEAIPVHGPDVLFLDIGMNHQNCFDVLTTYKDNEFEIIVTTAHEHYALKAIKVNALDYLLKPIDIEDLKGAVEKLRKKRSVFRSRNESGNFKGGSIRNQEENFRLVLSSLKEKHLVQPEEILFLQSERQYTVFHLKNKEVIMTSKNLGEYEPILKPYQFFRCHHSYLVNLKEVKAYTSHSGLHAIMSSGALVDVSKRKKDTFINQFQCIRSSGS